MQVQSGFLDRHVRPDVGEALADTRVVVILGARQVGKSYEPTHAIVASASAGSRKSNESGYSR